MPTARRAWGSIAAWTFTVARLPRIEFADIPQHVVQRGNDRQPCFLSDPDYRRYLRGLQEASLDHECRIHAYVLMTNHVHLLVTPATVGGVSRMMQHLGRSYVSYFNTSHHRTGTLWEGRFKSNLVDSERYLLACYRYIELNPVRAAMVEAPDAYHWSSYAHNALGEPNALVAPHPIYLALGFDDASRQLAYRDLVRHALSDDDLQAIRTYVQQQRVLGTIRFQKAIEAMSGRCALARPRGRPRKPPNADK
jgi:putative transposase